MLWLSIHLPQLPAQVFCRADLAHAPLVVCGPGPHRRVVAANPAAQACGISPHTRLASALALVPKLTLRDRRPDLETLLLDELASWSMQFTSHVALDPPEGVLLDIAGSLRLFGGLPRLYDTLRNRLTDLGVHAHIACAPTALAARWLSRSRREALITDLPTLERTLAQIPLHELDIEGALLNLLSGLGCHVVRDCLTLPRAGLAQRGAHAFLMQLDRALGRLPDPRIPFHPPPQYQARLELPTPTERDDVLLFASRRLLAGLHGTLIARQSAIEHFTLTLEHEDVPATSLDIHLGAACCDESRCTLLTREHLSACTLPAAVLAVALHASSFLDLPDPTAALFAQHHATGECQSLLIARLRARLGEHAVTQLIPHPDHRPERSTHLIPVNHAHQTPPNSPSRPLWLIDPPQQITFNHRILGGPERIESGWWDGHDTLRDYYIAQDSEGAMMWIFQDLHAPFQWFIHGVFS